MSYCGCDNPAPTDFYRKETRIARKKHYCGEEGCEKAICIGTRYVYIVGKSADYDHKRPWDIEMCLQCDEAWRRLEDIVDSAQGEVCRCLGALDEAIAEAFEKGYMEGMRDDEDVMWLIEHGYVLESAFVEEMVEALREEGEYIDYTDERQLRMKFAF